jgi:hypothetical protein
MSRFGKAQTVNHHLRIAWFQLFRPRWPITGPLLFLFLCRLLLCRHRLHLRLRSASSAGHSLFLRKGATPSGIDGEVEYMKLCLSTFASASCHHGSCDPHRIVLRLQSFTRFSITDTENMLIFSRIFRRLDIEISKNQK